MRRATSWTLRVTSLNEAFGEQRIRASDCASNEHICIQCEHTSHLPWPLVAVPESPFRNPDFTISRIPLIQNTFQSPPAFPP